MTQANPEEKQMQPQKDISKLSPDRLMRRFGNSKIVASLFFAFALHVVVLGATSVDYIHGLVDPAWKDEQIRLAEEAQKVKAAQTSKDANAAPPATKPATTKAAKGQPKKAPTAKANGNRKLPPELTTMPEPNEIPTAPGSGIGIDEMNK